MPTRYKEFGYWEIASRQMSIVTKSEQQRFKDAKITVIGTGGIGGQTNEMLARMGLGELTIIDKDEYDLSNLNRQTMNPYTKVNAINEMLTENNLDKALDGADIIIDALDNLFTRVIASRYAMEHDIPFIHGAIHGTQGQITVFTNETPSYEEMFSLPTNGRQLDEETKNELSKLTSGVPPVIGPVPNIIGCLEAMEAYKLITGIGEVAYAPKLLTFDLLDLDSFGTIKNHFIYLFFYISPYFINFL